MREIEVSAYYEQVESKPVARAHVCVEHVST